MSGVCSPRRSGREAGLGHLVLGPLGRPAGRRPGRGSRGAGAPGACTISTWRGGEKEQGRASEPAGSASRGQAGRGGPRAALRIPAWGAACLLPWGCAGRGFGEERRRRRRRSRGGDRRGEAGGPRGGGRPPRPPPRLAGAAGGRGASCPAGDAAPRRAAPGPCVRRATQGLRAPRAPPRVSGRAPGSAEPRRPLARSDTRGGAAVPGAQPLRRAPRARLRCASRGLRLPAEGEGGEGASASPPASPPPPPPPRPPPPSSSSSSPSSEFPSTWHFTGSPRERPAPRARDREPVTPLPRGAPQDWSLERLRAREAAAAGGAAPSRGSEDSPPPCEKPPRRRTAAPRSEPSQDREPGGRGCWRRGEPAAGQRCGSGWPAASSAEPGRPPRRPVSSPAARSPRVPAALMSHPGVPSRRCVRSARHPPPMCVCLRCHALAATAADKLQTPRSWGARAGAGERVRRWWCFWKVIPGRGDGLATAWL